jgi:hypothetical protein
MLLLAAVTTVAMIIFIAGSMILEERLAGERRFVVVVDGGSSGSRVFVYVPLMQSIRHHYTASRNVSVGTRSRVSRSISPPRSPKWSQGK